jgi:hypothetical protein
MMGDQPVQQPKRSSVEILWGMGPLLGADLSSWVKTHELTQADAARNLCTTPKTIKRWAAKKKRGETLPLWLEERLVARIRREARFREVAKGRGDGP